MQSDGSTWPRGADPRWRRLSRQRDQRSLRLVGPGSVDHAALASVMDEFAATVTGAFSVSDLLEQLAWAATRVLDIDGAGVMAAQEGGDLLRFVFATAAPIGQMEKLQQVLESGPCADVYGNGRIINIADLAVEGDWPDYQVAALELGLHAVTALPLRARGQTWGVLDLYRTAPRRLGTEELAAAVTLANLATSYLVVTADRDAAMAAQRQLADRAMHDPLTGLPVRWVFLEQLDHALAGARRHPHRQVAVLFLDLDGLKYVNDTYGHLAGDQLIRTCVQRIRSVLRPTEVLARIGGDEFVVLLDDLTAATTAVGVAQRILRALAQPYSPDGETIQPSASIGVAISADGSDTGDTLISHADAAMYAAKHTGRGRYELFNAEEYAAGRAAADAREELAAALRGAVNGAQLELYYQPILDLTDPGDGTVPLWGVEALARWDHPRRGMLPAQEFIGLAERGGGVVELDGWALATACQQLAAWDAELLGRSPARLFVNVSVAELTQTDLPELARQALDSAGVDPSRLTLEITETGLFSDPVAVATAMAGLRELGCHIAIDDFGTGYSSLSRLVQIPASVLKVDQSFTHGLRDGTGAVAVIEAVLQLGNTLDRVVIVEGVEDAETLAVLRDLGVTHFQGFYLARPQSSAAISQLLEQYSNSGATPQRPAGGLEPE